MTHSRYLYRYKGLFLINRGNPSLIRAIQFRHVRQFNSGPGRFVEHQFLAALEPGIDHGEIGASLADGYPPLLEIAFPPDVDDCEAVLVEDAVQGDYERLRDLLKDNGALCGEAGGQLEIGRFNVDNHLDPFYAGVALDRAGHPADR